MSLVKPDLSEITIPPIFCRCLREKNTHLERLDDTTDRYDISWKVANTSNCIYSGFPKETPELKFRLRFFFFFFVQPQFAIF